MHCNRSISKMHWGSSTEINHYLASSSWLGTQDKGAPTGQGVSSEAFLGPAQNLAGSYTVERSHAESLYQSEHGQGQVSALHWFPLGFDSGFSEQS